VKSVSQRPSAKKPGTFNRFVDLWIDGFGPIMGAMLFSDHPDVKEGRAQVDVKFEQKGYDTIVRVVSIVPALAAAKVA